MKKIWLGFYIVLFTTNIYAGDVIWEGVSAGFKIRWTTSEIVAVSISNQKVAFSAKQIAESDWMEMKGFITEDQKADPDYKPSCTYDRQLKVLSVVGPILSFSDDEYSFCQGDAHPSVSEIYASIDLRNPGKSDVNNLSMDQIFEEAAVFKALTADSYIQKALKAGGIQKTPEKLDDFISLLVEEAGCEFGIDTDLLERFAFHHVEGDKVAVRLGISHISRHVCNKAITELGLLFPIPTKIMEDLKNADSRKQGILQKDLKKIAGNKITKITYSLGDDSPE